MKLKSETSIYENEIEQAAKTKKKKKVDIAKEFSDLVVYLQTMKFKGYELQCYLCDLIITTAHTFTSDELWQTYVFKILSNKY